MILPGLIQTSSKRFWLRQFSSKKREKMRLPTSLIRWWRTLIQAKIMMISNHQVHKMNKRIKRRIKYLRSIKHLQENSNRKKLSIWTLITSNSTQMSIIRMKRRKSILRSSKQNRKLRSIILLLVAWIPKNQGKRTS